jgi:DNA repair exonuclease SbcCD nuclease subunit
MSLWMVFSDLHLKEWKQFSTVLANGLNSRFMEQIKVLQQVKHIARKNKVSSIFFLGDLMDSQSKDISKMVINTIFYLIQSLSEISSIYLLVGNHDVYKQINIFTPFTSIPRVTIIDQTTSIKLDGKTIDLIPCYGVWPKNKSDYCFGHFGIQGATIGDSFTIEEEIKPQALKDYKLVLAGHYHTRQQVGKNMYQIGSVMNTNFSNTIEDKGVFLLNPSNDDLQFIFIPSPKFYTINIYNENDIKEFKPEPNDYYKLKIKNDNIQVPEYPNVIVEYDWEPNIEEKELIDTSNITNLVPIIQEFIMNSNTSLDKEILKQKAVELLEI